MHALSLLSSYVKAARKVKDQPPLAVAGAIFGTFWDRHALMSLPSNDDCSFACSGLWPLAPGLAPRLR